jgi:hypothetical protein
LKLRTTVVSSVFVVAALGGCSSAGDEPRGGSAVTTGSGGAGVGGAGASVGGSTISPVGTGGSGTGEIGSTTSDAGRADPNGCGEFHFDLVRKPAQLLLVLDRSGSMRDPPRGATGASKWDITVPAVNQVISETDTTVSWGMKAFPEGEGSSCSAGTVTNKIDVAIAAKNAASVTGAVTLLTPQGNGTPTGDAIKQAVTYLQSLTDPTPKYILLATDGDPSCPNNNARPYAIQAVTDAATAGFHTFVVGVATGDSSTTTLNDMALAGQEPRDAPNPLDPKYYLANSQAELVSSLKQITGQVSNCVFHFATPPPVPSNIAVKIAGSKAEKDAANGWDYIGADFKGIEVHGTSCDKIKTSAGNQVEIVFGCPNVPIN